jgi:hypothetical protein
VGDEGARLFLPQGKNQEAERKFDVGEVVSIGAGVEEVKVGDIVVWQISTGFRIPNGIDDPNCWKVEEFPMSVIACLPNLDKEKRHAKWKDVDEDGLKLYHDMFAGLVDEEKFENATRSIPADVKIPAVGLGEIERPEAAEYSQMHDVAETD